MNATFMGGQGMNNNNNVVNQRQNKCVYSIQKTVMQLGYRIRIS